MLDRDWSKPLGLELIEEPQVELPLLLQRFEGAGVKTMDDHYRLLDQIDAIKALMIDGEWRTLQDIAKVTRYPTASISAQLRNLRKIGFGSHKVDKRRTSKTGGTWIYRLTLNPKEAAENLKKLEDAHRRYFYAKHPKPFNIFLDERKGSRKKDSKF
jgi:predicted transcriptional regulator